MTYSDIPLIIIPEIEQGEKMALEKYLSILSDQEKLKNIALVVEHNGLILGYAIVRPFSHNGVFGGQGYSEIVGLKVFNKYKNLGFENKLMKIAEKVGSEYSNFVYTSVCINDSDVLDLLIKRGYKPNKSKYKQNQNFARCIDCKNDSNSMLWLFKKLTLTDIYKFPVINTPNHTSLQWWADRLKAVYVHINIEKCEKINVDDFVFVEDVNSNACVIGKIIFKHKYDSYEELLKAEGVKNILPFLNDSSISNDDIEKVAQYFKHFPGSELVDMYGCVAFGIKFVMSVEKNMDLVKLKNIVLLLKNNYLEKEFQSNGKDPRIKLFSFLC